MAEHDRPHPDRGSRGQSEVPVDTDRPATAAPQTPSGWLTGAGLQTHAWWLRQDDAGKPAAAEPAAVADAEDLVPDFARGDDWFAPGEVDQLLGRLRPGVDSHAARSGGLAASPATAATPVGPGTAGEAKETPSAGTEQARPVAAPADTKAGDPRFDDSGADGADLHPWAGDFVAAGDEQLSVAGGTADGPLPEPAPVPSPEPAPSEPVAPAQNKPAPTANPWPVPVPPPANKLSADGEVIPPRQRDLAAASGLPAADRPPPPSVADPEELSRLAAQLAKATAGRRPADPAPAPGAIASSQAAPSVRLPRKPILGAATAAAAAPPAAANQPPTSRATTVPTPGATGAQPAAPPEAGPSTAIDPPPPTTKASPPRTLAPPEAHADHGGPPTAELEPAAAGLRPMVSQGRALEPELAPIQPPAPPKPAAGPPIRTRKPAHDSPGGAPGGIDQPETPGTTAPLPSPDKGGRFRQVAAGLLLLLTPPLLVWGWIQHGDQVRPWLDQLGWFDAVATGSPGPLPGSPELPPPTEGAINDPGGQTAQVPPDAPSASTPATTDAQAPIAHPADPADPADPTADDLPTRTTPFAVEPSVQPPGAAPAMSMDRLVAPGGLFKLWPPDLSPAPTEGAAPGLRPADWLLPSAPAGAAPGSEARSIISPSAPPAGLDPERLLEDLEPTTIPRAMPVDPDDLPVRRAMPTEP